jgi:hypothetical protein
MGSMTVDIAGIGRVGSMEVSEPSLRVEEVIVGGDNEPIPKLCQGVDELGLRSSIRTIADFEAA